ncbi:MAG: T9SS type A sorting domain-containing protein [Crocinitomicaceae bacterium]|nr:T9SS type A sorting domain-containing protein [Crocinitomicaceae bacterium]
MHKIILPYLIFSLQASAQNTWIQMDSLNGPGRSTASAFVLNDDAYVLTGLDEFGFKRSMVSYDISQNDWDDELSLGGDAGDGLNRGSAVAFNLGGFGFCGLGTGSADYFKDFWKFDPVSNSWTQVADFEGSARREAAAFVVGQIAYVGSGQDADGLTSDFYAYDHLTNTWSAISDFPGTARRDAVGFAMGGQGYFGTGVDASTYKNDFWAYYPLTDTWLQKADFPGTPRHGSIGFGMFPTAFVGMGEDNTFTYKKDIWEYNYFGDVWTQRANFPGPGRAQAIAVVIEGRAFVGTGYNGTFLDDFYEYVPLLSLDQNNSVEIQLFPNPVVDILTLSGYLNTISAIQVLNEKGQIIERIDFVENSSDLVNIGVNHLPAGIYFVQIISDNQTSSVCKFVKA